MGPLTLEPFIEFKSGKYDRNKSYGLQAFGPGKSVRCINEGEKEKIDPWIYGHSSVRSPAAWGCISFPRNMF